MQRGFCFVYDCYFEVFYCEVGDFWQVCVKFFVVVVVEYVVQYCGFCFEQSECGFVDLIFCVYYEVGVVDCVQDCIWQLFCMFWDVGVGQQQYVCGYCGVCFFVDFDFMCGYWLLLCIVNIQEGVNLFEFFGILGLIGEEI